jgi:hypothetical protein
MDGHLGGFSRACFQNVIRVRSETPKLASTGSGSGTGPAPRSIARPLKVNCCGNNTDRSESERYAEKGPTST